MMLQKTWQLLLDTVYPPRCAACEARVEQHGMLCAECWNAIHFLSEPLCAQCGNPFAYDMGRDAKCAECLENPPPFAHARAAFRYDGEQARRLIHSFKFHDRTQHTALLTQWMARIGSPMLQESHLLVPVPLHWWRMLKRGYNQSALLAQELQRMTGKQLLADALLRTRYTPPQASLDRADRLHNVRGVFAVKPKHAAAVRGKNILLVDDVMTTGATLAECAETLMDAGAKSVSVLTAARTCHFD